MKNRRKDPSFNICEEEKAGISGLFSRIYIKIELFQFNMKIRKQAGAELGQAQRLNPVEVS